MTLAGPRLERPVELAGLLDLGLKIRPDEMATNAVGKVDRAFLRQMAAAAVNRHVA